MALSHQKFMLSVTFRDSGDDEFTRTFELRGADYAAAAANAATVLGAFVAASDSKVASYAISDVFAEDAWAAYAGDTVRNSVQAVLTVDIAGSPNKKATIVIPAPKNAVFTAVTGAGSDVVSPVAALVTGVVNCFKAAGQAFISDGEDVADTPNTRGIRRTVYRRLAK